VRANRKAQEEIKLKEQKEVEKQAMIKQLEEQEAKRNQLQEELERKAVYEQFLERVTLDSAEEFQDIEDITRRHVTLEAANHDLKERMDSSQEEAEDQSARLAAFIKKKQTEVLVSNSQIAQHQQELKALRLNFQDNEAEKARMDDDAMERTQELGEVKMAIHNIFLRCRVRGTQPDANDDAALLEAIRQRVTDLQAIDAEYKVAQKRKAAEHAAAAAQAAALAAQTATLPREEVGTTREREASKSFASRAPDKSYASTAPASQLPAKPAGGSQSGSAADQSFDGNKSKAPAPPA